MKKNSDKLSIFNRFKMVGIELLKAVKLEKPAVSYSEKYQKNFKLLFDKSSPELKEIIQKKIECKEFNDFIQEVIQKTESEN